MEVNCSVENVEVQFICCAKYKSQVIELDKRGFESNH
jgi:hypothetical protein